MGSSQSTPAVETPTPTNIANAPESKQLPTKSDPTNAESTPATAKKESAKQTRTGIDLVNYRCRKKKATYDKCVSKWYNGRFLTGKSINQEEECGDLFDIYKQCYMKNLKKEFFDKGKKQVKEGSFLAEELDQ